MVVRTAKQGYYAGQAFLGCTRYPVCKGIQKIHVVRRGTRVPSLAYPEGPRLPAPGTLRGRFQRELEKALASLAEPA